MSDPIKILLGALGGAILALLLVGVFSGDGMSGMGQMMGGAMMGGGMFGMLFMLLFWVLVIALLVALIVFIVRQSRR